ncbi:ABC drug exporter AtrF [Pseudovirgaria hyperparasitica]|uniref:ABC drug exporter AtrF n=1 Tax=Pseudovirgaria hyperparasitica TaxID=470096 RepID=A0A6A6VUR4_9PEZI|nr:ABC drug exporter AtrF [Pseudovirgaria hyperparasitica]KAF2753895.1 ABC drug exporter AtrF [Pseudovirgaria hyperparasitica]
MWNGVHLPRDNARERKYEGQANPWHEENNPDGRAQQLDNEAAERAAGTWGERDTGISDPTASMQEFEALRRNLTSLSKSSSREDRVSNNLLTRTISGKSQKSQKSQKSAKTSRKVPTMENLRRNSVQEQPDLERQETRKSREEEIESPLEPEESPDPEKKESEDDDEFNLEPFIRDGHFEKRTEAGRSAKKVGVVFKDLTVLGVGSTQTFVKTLPDAIIGTFGPDLYKIVTRFVPALAFKKHQETRTLIDHFSGVVKDGEMMLVLGRPGSGCSTFLKMIANKREGYASVTGDVSYGGISAERQAKQFSGEVNYNPEGDVHFANLTVWQTLKFALLNKTKKRETGEVPTIITALLRIFGIEHTMYTPVGDEYTRGVSGGERKRVSIAETLATKSTVVCWDNSSRGLDSSTALDYARSLRIMTDVSNRTTIVTLYQAGEGIYEVMDKVMVIDTGKCIYIGPAKEAKQYFEELGFYCPDRQTTADFLTACTDPNERRFREGYEDRVPRTPEDLEKAFRSSNMYKRVQEEIDDYEKKIKESDYADAREFEQTTREQKSHRTVSKNSNFTVSFPRQVMACTQREFWLILGDRETLYTKFFIIISNGLIVGSLFYGQPLNTMGAFTRGGTIFFSILFLGWLQLSELMKAVSGRNVVARHKDYAFYTPSAVSVARVITDFPMIFFQVVIFGIIMYFMTSLDVDVSKFFIYLLFVYITTICITSLYRMFAALSPSIDDAVRFSGISLNLLVIYTGYVIVKPQLLTQYIWFGWIYYIDPIAYAFEAVLTNEFSDRIMECSPEQLVPQQVPGGPAVQSGFQGCSLTGAQPNAVTVPGADYLQTTYNYTRSHLWRNFGVVIAFTVLYLLVTIFAVEAFNFAIEGGGAMVFKKSKKAKQALKEQSKPGDEEKGQSDANSNTLAPSSADNKKEEQALEGISKSKSIFTWKDVEYTVPYRGGERKLLNNISGYAKPGKMIALMGASGAGKTTLLNTLAQRQSMGVVAGEMLVDGKALAQDFQRGTGFCEQMDLHELTASVREAIEFSALLRQDNSIPRSEKLAYVDTVIELLELQDFQDAIISCLGVEQKKRVTIGVELAAKPSLLLFLDEPTSGLDSQSAYSIVRFLKKLAAAGQAIVCTIHQPSSVLIQQFDMILALNPGGNTFYFGPVGDNGQDVIDYFAKRGVDCPPRKNVAEFILETAAKPIKGKDGRRIDWNDEWKKSDDNAALIKEIDQLCSDRSKNADQRNKEDIKAYAAPIYLQTVELTKRTFRQHWRDPSYYYGKLFVSVIIGIFNGFTFWKLGNSVQDMQNRMFTSFLIIVFPPTIVNAVVPKFFQNMALWQAREYPSRIYGWFAFTTAQVVTELPIAVVGAVIYWVLWYFPAGLPTDSSTAGYVFLMTMLFFFFQASWGQWICAFAPSFTVISNVLPFFFVMFSLFNGVVRPYSMLPVFWRYWMYYVNPSTYWIGGVLAATLTGQPIQCTSSETTRFSAPPGLTCADYAGAFASASGGRLENPDAMGQTCEYCQYTVGDQYLATLNIEARDKWPYFGIFLAFVVSNWALVYFFVWSVRVKGWGFGFGYLFGGAGKAIGAVKGLLGGKKKEGEAETQEE